MFDPLAIGKAKEYFVGHAGLVIYDNPEQWVKGIDVLAMMIKWKTFWAMNLDLINARLNQPVIFNGFGYKVKGFNWFYVALSD